MRNLFLLLLCIPLWSISQNCSLILHDHFPNSQYFLWSDILPNGDRIFLAEAGTWDKGYVVASKYDSQGNLIWFKELDPLDPNVGIWPYDACLTPSGGVVVSGSRYDYPTQENFFALELDSAGDFVWARIYQTSLTTSVGLALNLSLASSRRPSV